MCFPESNRRYPAVIYPIEVEIKRPGPKPRWDSAVYGR